MKKEYLHNYWNFYYKYCTVQAKAKLERDPAWEAITLESERIRLFKEYIIALEEACAHHHSRRKKSKKHKNRRSRSRTPSVSFYYYFWSFDLIVWFGMLVNIWGR